MMVHLAAPNAHLYVIVVEQLEHLKHAVYCSDSVDQGCPSSGLRVAVVTTCCTVEPHICGSSVCYPSGAQNSEAAS